MKRPGQLRRGRPRRARNLDNTPAIWTANLGLCQVCPAEGGECRGRLQGHHIIAKQALKKRGLRLYLFDLRNRLTVCEGRHQQHEKALHRIPRSLLPAAALAFAEELDLLHLIERYYPLDPRS